MSDLSLLGVFAHPDDEQLMSGAFAAAAAQGIKTGLICATRGEVGEISDPALASPETLGRVRENELRAASAMLGIKYLWFLGYRDSGMQGTAENADPAAFVNSNEDEALGKIVKIVREFKPAVMVTFEPSGGYGHPDHIAISRLATRAFAAAADPSLYPDAGAPWQVSRLFYSAFPRSLVQKMWGYFRDQGIPTGFDDIDLDRFSMPDEEVTTWLDTSDWADLKIKSLEQHRTQMAPDNPFALLPPDITRLMRASEYYSLVAGAPLPPGEQGKHDLYAGLQ